MIFLLMILFWILKSLLLSFKKWYFIISRLSYFLLYNQLLKYSCSFESDMSFFLTGCFVFCFQQFSNDAAMRDFLFIFYGWFYRHSWICGLISFICFRNFSTIIIFSNIMYFLSSLLSLPGMPMISGKSYHRVPSPIFPVFQTNFYKPIFFPFAETLICN